MITTRLPVELLVRPVADVGATAESATNLSRDTFARLELIKRATPADINVRAESLATYRLTIAPRLHIETLGPLTADSVARVEAENILSFLISSDEAMPVVYVPGVIAFIADMRAVLEIL